MTVTSTYKPTPQMGTPLNFPSACEWKENKFFTQMRLLFKKPHVSTHNVAIYFSQASNVRKNLLWNIKEPENEGENKMLMYISA